MAESAPERSPAEFADPEREYRAVEPWAVGGLLLGLLSPAALLGSLLLLVPPVGLLVNLVALARLSRDANRTGRPAALGGLALSVVFIVAPMAQMATSWVLLSRQARDVADQFLEYLREGSPEKAQILRFAPDQRQPLDELLWTYFRNNAEAKGNLIAFVANPTVRTILELGGRAQVRFYKTAGVATAGTRGVVTYYYTVTYPAAGPQRFRGKKTFLVAVVLERKPTRNPDINPWRVVDVDGGFDPDNPDAK
jgi:hypothetical protein